MQYRPLGQTGLQVSALGFGASPLGGALQGVPRDRYILATKVGRYGADLFDFSAARVAQSVEESLRRLRTEVIDLIQCHDMEFGSLDQIVVETLPALRRLREQGKVRFLGITGLPLSVFPYVLDRAAADTVLSYCHYTLNDSSLETLLPYLQAKKVGVINASPFAMGLLTEQGPPAWHPAPESIRAACARAAAYCRQQGADISRLALQFATANPQIATTLTGMASAEQVRKNVACLETPIEATRSAGQRENGGARSLSLPKRLRRSEMSARLTKSRRSGTSSFV
jgi:L-galactose dehydrogenase